MIKDEHIELILYTIGLIVVPFFLGYVTEGRVPAEPIPQLIMLAAVAVVVLLLVLVRRDTLR